MTEYTHRLTVCTPMSRIDEANALACIVGEHEADIGTFTEATHTRDGVEYACISTVVKDVFDGYLTGDLPDPPHAAGVDRAAALSAFASIGQPTGIVMDLRPRGKHVNVIQELGFEPIIEEDEPWLDPV